MARPRIAQAAAIAATLLLAAPAAAQTEPVYPIMCRSGGDMTFTAAGYVGGIIQVGCEQVSEGVCVGRQATVGFRQHLQVFQGGAFLVTFTRAGAGANSVLPNAGECAWLDRPVGAGEPNVLAVEIPGGFTNVQPVHVSSVTVNSQGRVTDLTMLGGGVADEFADFLWTKFRAPGELFVVYARASPYGRLVIGGYERDARGPS